MEHIIQKIGKMSKVHNVAISLNIHSSGELYVQVNSYSSNKSEWISIGSDWHKDTILCTVEETIKRLQEKH